MDTVNATNKNNHYYGNIVRSIFITVAIILLIGFPHVTHLLQIPGFFALCMIVVLGIAAGVTNPIQPRSMAINMYVAGLGLVLFAGLSWTLYLNNLSGFILVVNQFIAILFLIALYYSIKTFRAHKLNDHTS